MIASVLPMYRDPGNVWHASPRFVGLGAASVTDMINASAAKYGLDPALLLSVAKHESNLNPNAVSPAGAQGVMQLMPATAAQLGVTNAFDPAQNIDAGARYLSQMMTQFGDTSLALAAYNAGPGNVVKYGGIPPFAETQTYVSSILADVGESSTAGVDSPADTGDGYLPVAWSQPEPDTLAAAGSSSAVPLLLAAATLVTIAVLS